MRFATTGGRHIYVTLSRRNLKSLLAKLDGAPLDSACTISVGDYLGRECVVRAEEDATHYASLQRHPGPMHPDTEAAIKTQGDPQ